MELDVAFVPRRLIVKGYNDTRPLPRSRGEGNSARQLPHNSTNSRQRRRHHRAALDAGSLSIFRGQDQAQKIESTPLLQTSSQDIFSGYHYLRIQNPIDISIETQTNNDLGCHHEQSGTPTAATAIIIPGGFLWIFFCTASSSHVNNASATGHKLWERSFDDFDYFHCVETRA